MFTISRFLTGLTISCRGIATASKTTKIGIVGCGNVGSSVANNLSKEGFNVENIFDTDQSKMAAMPKRANRCSSAREVAEKSQVVITGLPRPNDVKAAAEGDKGILKGINKDKVWIDHSTTNYEQTQEYALIANQNGGHMLESPITGGLDALKKGQMIVYTCGNKEVSDAMNPIFETSYKQIFYVGPKIGSAMIVKVVSNMLVAVHMIAMGEALMLAKRSGFNLRTFWDAIRMSVGNSYAWETAAPVIFNQSYDPGFTIGLHCKDLQLGYDMATKFRVPMEMNQLALSIFREAQFQYGDEAGCYCSPKMSEDALKESLSCPNFENWAYDNDFVGGSVLVKHRNI